MEVVFMIFMTFVSVVSLFAVMVVVRDIVREHSANKQSSAAVGSESERAMLEQFLEELKANKENALDEQALPEKAEAPTLTTQENEEEATEQEAPLESEASEDEEDDGTVSFSASTSQTLEEKYMELPTEQKRFYDDIIKYAASKEASRRYYNQRYEEYKIGSKRIVRLRIKRGVVYCEFLLTNSDFRNYISENKIPVKQSATVIKVVDAATVDAVKNSIDIAVQLIAEEKEYKKQLAKEKRKQAREQKEG